MYNKLLNSYIKTIDKMFFMGFCVSAGDITKYHKNPNPLTHLHKCVYNGFLYAVYPITIPYLIYNIYKTN